MIFANPHGKLAPEVHPFGYNPCQGSYQVVARIEQCGGELAGRCARCGHLVMITVTGGSSSAPSGRSSRHGQ